MRTQRTLATVLLLGLAACDGSGRHGEEVIGPPAPVVVVEVKVAPATGRIQVGATVRLTATALDAQGGVVVGRACMWSSSDPQVANVAANGMVLGVRPGSVTITATCDGVSGGAQIAVEAPPPPPFLDQLGFRWAYEMAGDEFTFVTDVWASPDSVLFAAGWTGDFGCCGVVLRREQGVWNVETMTAVSDLWGVWGSGSRDVFFAGGGILHYDGESLTPMSGTGDRFFHDVWGSSATDVYAVGGRGGWAEPVRGTIMHYDGVAWTSMDSGLVEVAGYMNAIWGSSDHDVIAVGDHGTILHYDGHVWQRMTTPPLASIDLMAVWGSSAADVYAGGTEGTILHYDGTAWTGVPSPTTQVITSIHGIGAGEIYAVGSEARYPRCCGRILRLEGTVWTAAPHTAVNGLFGVWSLPGEIYAVGIGPTILHGTRLRGADGGAGPTDTRGKGD